MRVDLFDFDLPEERIAVRPAQPRDSARLLVVDGDRLEDRFVSDLGEILKAGDLMVLNNTRVFPAELAGIRPARDPGQGGPVLVHFSLHKQFAPDTWAAFARPSRRLRQGDVIAFEDRLQATVLTDPEGGEVQLKFTLAGAALFSAFHEVGAPPLPPYISSRRAIDEKDFEDYQTVFAEEEGSVAAPTAGLHFTKGLLDRLTSKGILFEEVTLHVGAGTFLPVKVADTDDHKMHAEWGEVSAQTASAIRAAKEEGRRVIAVGTTSLRLLESAARKTGAVEPFSGETDIFMTPGFTFYTADILMTNFHLPRSTLFMLVSAFVGVDAMKTAYGHAISSEYRFYSYGDASLLFRDRSAGGAR